MRFDINPYYDAFRDDCIEKGIWEGYSWMLCFHKLGFSSYEWLGYEYGISDLPPHYLSEEEFVVFVLRYS